MPKLVFALLLVVLVSCSKELTSDQYLANAVTHFAEGEYEAALIELKNVLQREPGQPQARCLLGKIYLENGSLLDAEKELVRARELGCAADVTSPLLADTLLSQGKFEEVLMLDSAELKPDAMARLLSLQTIAALSTGDQDLAEELVSLAESSAPDAVDTQLARARLLVLDGSSEAALAAIRKVLEIAPENDDAWRLRGHTLWRLLRLPEARTAFDNAITHTKHPVADYVSRGLINILMEDFSRAQKDAEALAEVAQHHPGSSYISGLLLFRAGQYRDAITTLSLGEAAAAKYPLMLFYMSIAHVIDGDPAVAETYALKYVKLVPDSIEGRKLLGLLLLQRGVGGQVAAVLQPVLDHNPNDLGALHLSANALLIDDRADLALFTYDWIGRVYPALSLADLPLTTGLLTKRQAMGATAALQNSLKPSPKFPREDVLSVLAALKQQDFDEAIEAAKSYKFRDLTGIAPYNVLGNVYLAAGDAREARKTFRQALKRAPGNPSASLNLAQIERKMNELKKERKLYQEVLTVHTGHLPAMLRLAVLEGREGDNAEMVDRLKEAIDIHEDALEPRLGLAQYYHDSGKPEKVVEIFASLPSLQKRSSRVREMIINSYLKQGKLKEALAYSRKAYADDPNTQTLLGLVAILKNAKQDAVARERLVQWLSANPADIIARLRLAEELDVIASPEATEQYREVLQREPQNLVALNNLAWNTRNEDPAGALTHIRKAADIAPDNGVVQDTLAVVEHLNGNNEEAIKHIGRALKNEPTNSSMRFHQAMINAALGKTKEAVATLRVLMWIPPEELPERAQVEKLLATLEG